MALKWLGIENMMRIFPIIKQYGGIRGTLYHLYRADDCLKEGTLIGEDKYGNKYYQNNRYFYGKNRWVIYNPNVGVEYDGSMIPAEWFGWMHYKTDIPPTEKAPVKYKWIVDHDANPSATAKAYVPYSTAKPKIQSWTPGQK